MSWTGQTGRTRFFAHDQSVASFTVQSGTVKRILQFALPYWPLLALFLIVVALDSLIVIANPLFYRDIINKGMLKGNIGVIYRLAAFVCLLGLVDGALGLFQSFLSAKIGARIAVSLRTKLFEHVLRMPVAFFSHTQTGALIGRFNNEAGAAQNAITDVLATVVGNLIVVCSLVSVMFVLSWRVALIALLVLPVFIFVARLCSGKLQQITQTNFHFIGLMNNIITERFSVSGALLTKLYGRPSDDTQAFRTRAEDIARSDIERTIYGRLVFVMMSLTAVFATAATYGMGGALVVKHSLDVGTVVALASYLTRLYVPFAGLSNIQVTVLTALVSFQRTFEVFDLKPVIEESPYAIDIPQGPARISVEGLCFAYPKGADVTLASLQSQEGATSSAQKAVLEDLDFIAEPGQITALVGPSGAGKTTLAQLICRLYDPLKGFIAINGVNLRNATFDSLRTRIGFVTQDAHLFHDTIRANLLYAKPNATDEELIEVLRLAQILPLIDSLHDKLDTIVGERGYRFSGGERQRLAIARLLLRNPDIVILDEATAHLDSESEGAIQRTFEIALRGRTAIIIAHRLSTILRADQILVLNGGRIVERGRHSELIKKEGLYAVLYQRQFAQESAVLDAALVN